MGSWNVSLLPKIERGGSTYCYFGVNESHELFCIGGKKKRHQEKRKCAASEFAKKTFEVFKSQEKLEKKIRDEHKVSRVKDERDKSVTYIMKMKVTNDPVEAFRKKVSEGLQDPFHVITGLVAIKIQTLRHLVKTHQHLYEGHLFHQCTWTALKKAVAKKYI